MNNAKPKPQIKLSKRTIVIGTETFILPLNQSGYYVSDSTGRTVMECGSINVARKC